ncbi:restriction endonuclease subunit S [Mycoplasmopsis felis]|uniref:restriction endonuclease subunit S n=1 Tax=Mycoplasmopsis felis TaxID=33923 RepID=UPI002AFF0676|nr:restriction endonuclease subunit S [Mycoplasmopsis felis]WQQ05881.1 restriction endonuclease subunit S [Mycoplasmopsis felis]
MKKNLVPRVRFKGFDEEWKEEKIESFSKITIGEFVIKTKQNDFYEYPVYNGGITNTGFYKEYNNEGNKIIVSARGANAGHINFIEKKYWAGNSCYSIDLISNRQRDIKFIFYSMLINKNKFDDNKQVGTIPSVSLEDVRNFIIYFASYSEQQKIGKLLDQISNLITHEEIKLNKLKQLKETLLQKMFPEGNSKTPRIRFKGFEGEWKEEKLEETVNILDNLRIPVKESLRSPGAYKYYGANGIQGKINGYTHKGENILIAEDGANDLNNYPLIFEKNKIWVNNHAHVVTSNNPNLLKNYFLYLSLKKVNFSDYILGTQRYKLTLSNLKEVLFVITKNISEQQKIGDFFSKIDSLLSLYQSKLNKLKQIKEALLQKMFV